MYQKQLLSINNGVWLKFQLFRHHLVTLIYTDCTLQKRVRKGVYFKRVMSFALKYST